MTTNLSPETMMSVAAHLLNKLTVSTVEKFTPHVCWAVFSDEKIFATALLQQLLAIVPVASDTLGYYNAVHTLLNLVRVALKSNPAVAKVTLFNQFFQNKNWTTLGIPRKFANILAQMCLETPVFSERQNDDVYGAILSELVQPTVVETFIERMCKEGRQSIAMTAIIHLIKHHPKQVISNTIIQIMCKIWVTGNGRNKYRMESILELIHGPIHSMSNFIESCGIGQSLVDIKEPCIEHTAPLLVEVMEEHSIADQSDEKQTERSIYPNRYFGNIGGVVRIRSVLCPTPILKKGDNYTPDFTDDYISAASTLSFPDRKEYAIALLAMASDQVNNMHQVDVVVALVRIIDASVLSSHAEQVIDLMMESNPLWARQMQAALAL
jgi:hypothetical protein